jgi:hypothetical protein
VEVAVALEPLASQRDGGLDRRDGVARADVDRLDVHLPIMCGRHRRVQHNLGSPRASTIAAQQLAHRLRRRHAQLPASCSHVSLRAAMAL